MKKLLVSIYFIASILFSAVNLYAQDKNVKYRFFYNSTFRVFEGAAKTSEQKVLEISKDYTMFVSTNYERRLWLTDSLTRVGASREDKTRATARLPRCKEMSIMYKNYPTKGKLTMRENALKYYVYTEDVEKINWKTLPGDTTICDFSCKKAQCTFRGRTWNVWYAPEISISEGPWKLAGLPGIIMAATDTKGDFSYICVGMDEPTGIEIVIPDMSSCIKCTREEFMKTLTRFHADPSGYEKSLGGTGVAKNIDGSIKKYDAKKTVFRDL